MENVTGMTSSGAMVILTVMIREMMRKIVPGSKFPSYATFFCSLGIILLCWLVYWGITRYGEIGEVTAGSVPEEEVESRYEMIDNFIGEINRKSKVNDGVLTPIPRNNLDNREKNISVMYQEIHKKGKVKKLIKCLYILFAIVGSRQFTGQHLIS